MARRVPTVVYDGDCAFCRQSVDWARRRDRGRLVYSTAAGARQELDRRGLLERAQQTVLVLTEKKAYEESAAVVRVLWRLRRGWPVAGAALWVVPKPLRDWGYRQVAMRKGPLRRRRD